MANNLNHISSKETNNQLIYTIFKPQGSNSKVNVSLKDRLLLVDVLITEEKKNQKTQEQSFQYSQSSYSQSIQVPSAYEPSSMDVKTKHTYVLVTFDKKRSNAVGASSNIA